MNNNIKGIEELFVQDYLSLRDKYEELLSKQSADNPEKYGVHDLKQRTKLVRFTTCSFSKLKASEHIKNMCDELLALDDVELYNKLLNLKLEDDDKVLQRTEHTYNFTLRVTEPSWDLMVYTNFTNFEYPSMVIYNIISPNLSPLQYVPLDKEQEALKVAIEELRYQLEQIQDK